jgi:hypothetical protein
MYFQAESGVLVRVIGQVLVERGRRSRGERRPY